MSVPTIPRRDLVAIFDGQPPVEPESPPVSKSTAFAIGFLATVLIHALFQTPALSIFAIVLGVTIALTAKTLADYGPRILKALKGEGGWR